MLEQKSATYDTGYAEWKAWDADDFGAASRSDAAYFDAELRRAGFVSLVGLRVLEVGFGNGALLMHMQRSGAKVSGTEAIGQLVDRACAAGVDAYETMNLDVFADASFDCVVMMDVLEHIPQSDLPGLLEGIHRVLGPAGRLVARFPNGDSPLSLAIQNGDVTHITYLGSAKIRYLLERAGLALTYVGPPATLLMDPSLSRRLLKIVQWLPRRVVEMVVKALFFPMHEIHYFSSNLVINAVRADGNPTTMVERTR